MLFTRRQALVLAGAGLTTLAYSLHPLGALAAGVPTKQQAQQPPIIPFPGALTFRLYATREGLVGYTTANGHKIVERDRFVALPSRLGLSSKNGYEKQVLINYKGRYSVAPVWDIGPWNIKDNYWDPPELRVTGKGLPRGWPAAHAQFFDGASGGISDKGHTVKSPAGIDLADGLFWDDLKMTGSDWVDVTFLWLSPGGEYFTQPLPAGVRNPIAPFSSTASKVYFAETGHSLANPFKAYWDANGGLLQFGYPLTEPFTETLDGKPYTVQYFERARFEHHPEKADPQYQVLLGFLGKAFHPLDPPAQAIAGARFFAETGHNLSGRFREYWEQRGGLSIYGFPITEVFNEVNSIDGKTYKTQYFERARFEYHPENPAPTDVLLGHLGRQLLDVRGAFTK